MYIILHKGLQIYERNLKYFKITIYFLQTLLKNVKIKNRDDKFSIFAVRK